MLKQNVRELTRRLKKENKDKTDDEQEPSNKRFKKNNKEKKGSL